LEFRRDFWRQKTRVPGLSYDVVCVILRLAILVQCRLVTDRPTDGQTHDDSIYRTGIILFSSTAGLLREGSLMCNMHSKHFIAPLTTVSVGEIFIC